MIDLNTSLTIIIYYGMYPTLFRRKEQTWKRLRVGLRTDDNIPKNASSIRDVEQTIEGDLNPRRMNALLLQ